MSLAQRTTSKPVPPDKRKRVGGPRQANQEDSPGSESEDVRSRSGSDDSAGDDWGPSTEPAQSSSAAPAHTKGQRGPDPAATQGISRQGPSMRSSAKSAASASTVTQGASGKDEAGPTQAQKTRKKVTTTRRQGQQEEEGDALGREEQEEFLLRERSMAAMEQRVLTALRGEVGINRSKHSPLPRQFHLPSPRHYTEYRH